MSARYLSPTIIGTTVISLLSVACGGSSPEEKKPLIVAKGAYLHQAADCEDLLQQIQEDAIVKLNEQVELYKKNGQSYYGTPVSAVGGSTSGAGNNGNIDLDVGAPEVGGDDAGSKGEAVSDPSSHSTTNTQVADVDEADIVKLSGDGKRMYVVHGTALKVLSTWPATDAEELAETTVAGSPFEMFEHEGTVTVFSTVYPTDLPQSAAGSDAKLGPDYYCGYGGAAYTQITVFDVSDDSFQLKREMIFEGNYVSSRRHDSVVRAVIQGGFVGRDIFYPDIDYYDSFGRPKSEARISADLDAFRDEVTADIRSTTLDDWIPSRFERKDGAWAEIPAQCDGYFVPQPGLVESGVTQVVTLESGSEKTPAVVSVLGGADLVYASTDSLVVAQADYRWDQFQNGGPQSALHQFALGDTQTSYSGSGFVPGVAINQFALDQKGDVLRIVTTEDNWTGDPKNRLFTLKLNDGTLEKLDQSELLGEPGERVYSVRYIEDRAYVVTFRQTDPLYALDVKNPSDIKVLGELHIPGFSEYMHPLGEDKLITIGQDADEAGVQSGVALQIFDVSDPSQPEQLFKHTFGGFSYSEASYNHKAFTYVKDYFDGGDDLLMFPLVTYESYQSTLKVLRISETDGFTELGSIDHSALINRECATYASDALPCYYYGGDEMRRGLQVDDFVYALSQGGVTVHDLSSLSDGPLTTVPFDVPDYSYDYGYGDVCYGIDYGEPAPGIGIDPPQDMAIGGSSGF